MNLLCLESRPGTCAAAAAHLLAAGHAVEVSQDEALALERARTRGCEALLLERPELAARLGSVSSVLCRRRGVVQEG